MSTENPTATETTQTTTEQQPDNRPYSERMREKIAADWNRVAEEDAAKSTKEKPEAQVAAEPTKEEKAVEAKPETQTTEEADPFTEEQLSDPAFFDKLDAEGWKKLEQFSPALYRKGKAVASALGKALRAAQLAQKQPKPDTTEPSNQPAEEAISPELKDAIRRANSLDERESLKGLQDVMKNLVLTEVLPDLGIDPNAAKAQRIMKSAYASVVVDLPEISTLDGKELDAVIDSSKHLQSLLETADTLPDAPRTQIYANVMRQAGETVLAKKKADAETAAAKTNAENKKKADQQRRERSNVNIASNAVVESPSGGAPQQKKPMREFIKDRWNEAAAVENGG